MIWSLVGDFAVLCLVVYWIHAIGAICAVTTCASDFRILFFGFGPAQKFADDEDFFYYYFSLHNCHRYFFLLEIDSSNMVTQFHAPFYKNIN